MLNTNGDGIKVAQSARSRWAFAAVMMLLGDSAHTVQDECV